MGVGVRLTKLHLVYYSSYSLLIYKPNNPSFISQLDVSHFREQQASIIFFFFYKSKQYQKHQKQKQKTKTETATPSLSLSYSHFCFQLFSTNNNHAGYSSSFTVLRQDNPPASRSVPTRLNPMRLPIRLGQLPQRRRFEPSRLAKLLRYFNQ